MSETSDGPALLIVKGSFAQYGGAERDVVQQLETWLQVFSSARIATLHGHPTWKPKRSDLAMHLIEQELNSPIVTECRKND